MLRKNLFTVICAMFVACGVFAAPWAAHNSRRMPRTLIVIGNYKTPRLMAETILNLTGQPYLLVTQDGRYIIAMRRASQEIPAAKLGTYINNLNPRRLVIIGDKDFVNDNTEKQLRTINLLRIPIVRIYGDDWVRVAEELDDLLNIGNLSREFCNNYRDMSLRDRPLRNPGRAAAKPAAPVAPAAPAADDAAADRPVADPVAL